MFTYILDFMDYFFWSLCSEEEYSGTTDPVDLQLVAVIIVVAIVAICYGIGIYYHFFGK